MQQQQAVLDGSNYATGDRVGHPEPRVLPAGVRCRVGRNRLHFWGMEADAGELGLKIKWKRKTWGSWGRYRWFIWKGNWGGKTLCGWHSLSKFEGYERDWIEPLNWIGPAVARHGNLTHVWLMRHCFCLAVDPKASHEIATWHFILFLFLAVIP